MIRSFEILVLLVASVVFVCAEVEAVEVVEAVEAVEAVAEAVAEVAVADEDWDEGISEELKILLIQVAVVLLIAFACAYCGWLVGSHKGRGRQGFWLGFFLGPMGVMTVGFLPAKESNPFKSDR